MTDQSGLEDADRSSAWTGWLVIVLSLMALGLVMIATASSTPYAPTGRIDFVRDIFTRQLVFGLMGTLLLIATAQWAWLKPVAGSRRRRSRVPPQSIHTPSSMRA